MSAAPGPRAPPRLDLSARAWKLWIAAALSAAFAVSCLAIDTPGPPPRERAPAPARPAARPPRTAEAPRAPRRPQRRRIRTRSS
jgi:hypothetical protein